MEMADFSTVEPSDEIPELTDNLMQIGEGLEAEDPYKQCPDT